MALSALTDKSRAPEAAAVAAVLGPAATWWDDLVRRVTARFGPITEEWKHPGAKYGWSLRLKRRERNLIYLIPGHGSFLVALVFGERAVEAIRASDVRDDVKAMVEAATPYVEGRGIRFAVTGKADLALVERLLELKVG